MLTSRTKLTLALLRDIYHSNHCHIDNSRYASQDTPSLLVQLETAHLLQLIPGKPSGLPSSYILSKDYAEITLLEVLYAINEGICFNRENGPDFYSSYGCLARKLGVMNHMVRLYLSEIHIFDFPMEYPENKKNHQ